MIDKKNMTKYFKLALAACALVAAAGCSQFDEYPQGPQRSGFEGRLVTAGIEFSVAAELDEQGREIPITRAPLDVDETKISNVWVFQFGEPVSGDDGSRILIHSCYVTEGAIETARAAGDPIPVNLIESGAQKHLLAFVANLNDGGYGWNMTPGRNTYADLMARSYQLVTGSEESILYGDDKRNVIMSGAATVKVAEGLVIDADTDNPLHEAGVTLTPSLAKIQLELTAGNPDYRVLSVKVRNMPDRICFTDAINTHAAIEPLVPSLIDFPIAQDVASGLVPDGETAKFVWYVPRNTRGSHPAVASAADKNLYAPVGATCIEITAKHVTNGSGVLYRIYPGADKTDFNVIPNHRYIVRQTITGNGGANPTDSRIEQFGNVRLDGANNCFILNPPATESMGPRTFEIPITQVNRYWAPDAQTYRGYGGLNEGAILSNTWWRVDLLWQDAAGIVRSSTAGDYDPAKHVTISEGRMKGPDEYFTVTVPPGATHGNFVVALRAYDPDSSPYPEMQTLIGQVLWSWHLWITDYNPNPQKIAVQGDRFTYPVTGGQVERYGGTLWGYSGTTANNWNNYTYAVTEPSTAAPYAKSFMMDRNIGAINPSTYPGSGRGSFYYQYGRKDPFPGNITLYRIDGTALAASKAAAPADFLQQYWAGSNANGIAAPAGVNVKNGVTNPMVFYTYNFEWSGLGERAYLWMDAAMLNTNATAADLAAKTGMFGKSIYDPCPNGWKLPLNGVWDDFRPNITANIAARGLSFSGNALHYWPNIQKGSDYPVEGDIHYFATGYRDLPSGMFYGVGTIGYYWAGTPVSETNARNMQITGNINPQNILPRANGFPVRCVSE